MTDTRKDMLGGMILQAASANSPPQAVMHLSDAHDSRVAGPAVGEPLTREEIERRRSSAIAWRDLALCDMALRSIEQAKRIAELENSHPAEGTIRCTCSSYPHTPNCGLDDRIVLLRERIAELEAQLRERESLAGAPKGEKK